MIRVLSDFHLINGFSLSLSLIPAVFNLGIILYIVFFMPRNSVSAMFALFTFALLLWQLSDSLDRSTTNPLTLQYWDNILSWGWIFYGPLGLHFSLLYTGNRKYADSLLIKGIIYIPALFFEGSYQAGIYAHPFNNLGFWGLVNPHNGHLLDIIQLNWISLTVFTTMGVLGYYAWQQRHNPLRHYQSLIIAVGLAIPTAQGFLTQVIFPIALHLNPIPVTSTFLFAFSIATLVSLNKYKLFNLSELARIDSILENMKDVVFTISTQKSLTYINPYGAKMMGWHKSDIESYSTQNLFALNSDDSAQFKNRVLNPSLEGKVVENVYLKLLTSDGQTVPVLISADPIYNNNQLQGVLVVARNIADLQQAQDRLRISERKYRALIEKSSDAIGMMDEAGRFIYLSPVITNILGYKLEEFADKKLFDFVPFHQKAQISKMCTQLLKQPGKSLAIELELKNGSGHVIWIEGIGTNLLADQAVKAIVFNIRNITERKAAEEAMRHKNTELEKINNELDRFVYSASHDLRSPLTNIIGLIDVTGLEPDQQQHGRYLTMMRNSVNQMDETIKEILDYSRNNRTETIHEKINLEEIIDSTFNGLQFTEGASAIQKIINVQQEVPFYTDRVRIKFILNNLVTNAIKYHNYKQSAPFISINVQVTETKAVIIVQDNGSGIKQDSIDKVFDMFYRATTLKTGAGLGLYIVKEAVTRLNGTITVDSKVNTGSTFTVEIPNYMFN